MSEQSFDAFTRRATAEVSRRGTLMTLGGAALAAALANSFSAEAKNNNNNKKKKKKAKKKARKKAEQECTQQAVDCQAILNSLLDPTPEQLACCDSLATCDASLFLVCLFTP